MRTSPVCPCTRGRRRGWATSPRKPLCSEGCQWRTISCLSWRCPLSRRRNGRRGFKVRKSLGIQLSGGERRRCEIARALAIDPKFILLDEPFAGVDPIAVEDIQHIIAKLKYKNIGVIITDHNVGETLAIIDRAYLLYEGNILQSGTPEELAADEEVRTKYLGSTFVLKRSAAVTGK